MKTTLSILIVVIVIGALFVFARRSEAPATNTTTMNTFTLVSPVFEDEGLIPSKYTCDGDNINPPLVWSGAPEGTRSFALLMDDPDIPQEVKSSRGIDVFDHWVVFNLPPTANGLNENAVPAGVEGNNGAGALGYTGPCPPPQYEPKEHRYFFKLYALDTMLGLSSGVTKANVEEAMQTHILQQTELIGRYSRQ